MKIMITILGILIAVSGVIPFLGESGLNILPPSIPTSGIGYYVIIIVIGAVGVVYGFMNNMLIGKLTHQCPQTSWLFCV